MGLEVRVLGSGDAFGSGGRLQACIWMEADGYRWLVDCGATSLVALRRAGLDPNEVDAVLVSHFHGDHFGGVPYLVLEGQFRRRARRLTIAGPRGIGARVDAAMEDAFPGSSRTPQRFAVEHAELSSTPTAVGPISVRALPVAHTPGSEAVGLRIAAAGRVVAYSGDTEWTDALVALAADADLFIAEAYSFEKAIPYHLSYRALESRLASLSARRTVITHLGPDTLERLGEVRLEAASDGTRILLD